MPAKVRLLNVSSASAIMARFIVLSSSPCVVIGCEERTDVTSRWITVSATGWRTVSYITILKGNIQSAPFKDAIVDIEVPDKGKVLGKAAFFQH